MYDVVVAGGSIGGMSAAYHAAHGGAKVLMLDDKKDLGGFKCAEGILAHHLTSVGIPEDDEYVSLQFRKVSVFGPGGQDIHIEAKHQYGLILDRQALQYWMERRCEDAGVEIRKGERVTDLDLKEGTLTSKKDTYEGKVFVDGTGIGGHLGRQVRPEWWPMSRDHYAPVLQKTIRAHGMEEWDDRIALWFGSKYAPGGYSWIFPKGDHTYNIGLGGISSLIRGTNAHELLARFVADLVPLDHEELYQVGSRLPVAPPLQRYTFSMGGHHLMLIGDAARLCWPLTGAGIYVALLSGRLAGEHYRDPEDYQRRLRTKTFRKQQTAYRLLEKYRTDKGMAKMLRRVRFILFFHGLFPSLIENRAFGSWRLN